MLLASSLSALDTSSASLMQESLYRARIDPGVLIHANMKAYTNRL